MSEGGLLIGDVAELAGVSADTVRFYERRRLLPRAPRSGGGFRLFTPDAVERIRFIKQAQETGLSLEEIAELIAAVGGTDECRRVHDLLRGKLAELDGRIEAMRRFRRTLSRYYRECEETLSRRGADAECPVLVEIAHVGSSKARGSKAKR
jgi:DNA-binding transcriptional MerR regulator